MPLSVDMTYTYCSTKHSKQKFKFLMCIETMEERDKNYRESQAGAKPLHCFMER